MYSEQMADRMDGGQTRDRRENPATTGLGAGLKKMSSPLSRVLAYKKPLVCIVRFSDKYGAVNGIPREAQHVFYQVVVDPDRVSRSGMFIEFGHAGDQICGWKPIDSIDVHEVLGEASDRTRGSMKEFDIEAAEAQLKGSLAA